MKDIKGFFKRYPKQKEIFMTLDGQAFYELNGATNHAANLGDRKEILTVTPDNAGDVEARLYPRKEATATAAEDPAAASEATAENTDGTAEGEAPDAKKGRKKKA